MCVTLPCVRTAAAEPAGAAGGARVSQAAERSSGGADGGTQSTGLQSEPTQPSL